MAKYIVTITERYEVEAETPEQALASYRISFEDGDPEILGLATDQVIPQDEFEYLDGKGEVEEVE